jgi:hypothetical protein
MWICIVEQHRFQARVWGIDNYRLLDMNQTNDARIIFESCCLPKLYMLDFRVLLQSSEKPTGERLPAEQRYITISGLHPPPPDLKKGTSQLEKIESSDRFL